MWGAKARLEDVGSRGKVDRDVECGQDRDIWVEQQSIWKGYNRTIKNSNRNNNKRLLPVILSSNQNFIYRLGIVIKFTTPNSTAKSL